MCVSHALRLRSMATCAMHRLQGVHMASIGRLVAAIAAAEGMDEGTVKIIARYCREAGHVSQGTHGPGAAKMTARDAANILIAVNASTTTRSAVAALDI